MLFKNLTPHIITILDDDNTLVMSLRPQGIVARVQSRCEVVAVVGGVPLQRQVLGQIQDLPEPAEGFLLVVSAMVRMALPERKDLCSPGDLVRGTDGNPVGCKGLVCN